MLLSVIAAYLGIKNGVLKESIFKEYNKLDKLLTNILDDTSDTENVAKLIKDNDHIFYLGRKIDYALCMEASLKLKEISYIHSEAYAAGELKHGTISLVEKDTPVISVITDEDIKLKTLSNVKEVCARGALSVLITDQDIDDKEIYSVCTSEHMTWGEVADIYKELIGLEAVWVDIEDFLGIISYNSNNPMGIRYQLIYDRLFDRIMDNSKVLEITGMKQSELTTLYDGLKRELAGVNADTFVEAKNSPIMDQYLKERGL
jgi:hypothetical protein